MKILSGGSIQFFFFSEKDHIYHAKFTAIILGALEGQ